MVRARFRVEGAGVCLQSPLGDLATVWGRWAGRDGGERTQQEALASYWRELAGAFGCPLGGSGTEVPSGWKWNRSQPCQGAAELDFPRPMLGKMQGEAVRRAGEPSRQGEEPPPEGLGGHDLLAQTDSRCPAGHGAITCTASQAALAAKRPDGMWFSPTPYLRSRMAFSISAWRRWSASSSRSPRPGR